MNSYYAWAEIDLRNLGHNLREIKKRAGREKCVIAVVKSNAYGHGAVPVAKALARAGANFMGVAIVDEAEELRTAGLHTPIMIMSRTLDHDFARVVCGNFIQFVGSFAEAQALNTAARKSNKKQRVHIKVDTGMNRLGLDYKEALEQIENIVALPYIKAEGILSHFVESDNIGSAITRQQVARFKALLLALQEKGTTFTYIHQANSAGVINVPDAFFNTVRTGLALYGYYPGARSSYRVDLKPVLSLKSRVIHIRTVERRESVSYAARWRAAKDTQVAIISIGYSDGYPRHFTNVGNVLIRGVKTTVLGTVCMNHIIVSVDKIKGVKIGDEVVLYGRQGKAKIAMEDAARSIGTIPYELTCRVRQGLPRVYRGYL
jgi:alanine racemase